MTTSPNPDDPDTEGRTLPPYEDRRKTADVDGKEKGHRDGANVGGATGPVVDDEMKADDPESTPRGAVASPSDEQPATESEDTDLDPDMTGPAHTPGTPRGEDGGA